MRTLARRGLLVLKRRPFDPAARQTGGDWPLFGYTMIGMDRLSQLQRCIETVLAEAVPGDLIETGVWRGGACIFMRAVLKRHGVTDRTVWAADSFQGFPQPAAAADTAAGPQWDLSGMVTFDNSLDTVKAGFERFGLLDGQVRFLPGWFKDTLPAAPIDRLAVLRLDGDLYESTMDALVSLYPKVSPGGFVIVDDYHGWAACRQAVTEYRTTHGVTEPLVIDRDAVFWRVGREPS
jgi:O-methyltransferase